MPIRQDTHQFLEKEKERKEKKKDRTHIDLAWHVLGIGTRPAPSTSALQLASWNRNTTAGVRSCDYWSTVNHHGVQYTRDWLAGADLL
jgi:hypothetical protein